MYWRAAACRTIVYSHLIQLVKLSLLSGGKTSPFAYPIVYPVVYPFKVSFQVVSEMAGARIWQLCILCHKQTEEVLVCPLANPVASRREGAYTEITSLARQFRAIGAAPHPYVELPDEESMQKNYASWHKSCRQLYRASALDHANKRHNE